MIDQYIEIMSSEKSIFHTIQSLIDNRVLGKMEIPDTRHRWVTTVLKKRKIKPSSFIILENIEGFESILSSYPNQEVSLEFMTKGGVPCRFRTKIVEFYPKEILAELPSEVYRIQKRRYLRTEAPPGTEITFHRKPSGEEKAKVVNFCEGGAAFFVKKDVTFDVGDVLVDVYLNVPKRPERLSFHIPRAVVRRIKPPSLPLRRTLCAIEFLKMTKETRNKLMAYISKQHMVSIQKLKG
jgi:c-di-GMP-binding flagellar brake protein YcgR